MLYEEYLIEIKLTILNVFHSKFTSKEISEETGISYTTIVDLRSLKRNLDTTNFKNIESLYLFGAKHNLSYNFLSEEKKKGKYRIVPIDVPIKKIIVAFDEMELFPLGYLISEDNLPIISEDREKLEHIRLPNSGVVIDRYNHLFDAYQLGLSFNVNYNGGGPNTFVRFLEKYSKIPLEEIKRKIYTESILEYDFDYDTLTPLPSRLPEFPFELYKKNGRLIIAINNSSNDHFLSIDDDNDNNKIIALSKTIKEIIQIMENSYHFNVNPVALHYVPERAKNRYEYNLKDEAHYFYDDNQYHMIFEFLNFEIWLPFSLGIDKGNPFKHPVYQNFFENLNYYLNEEELNFFKQKYKEYIESNEPLDTIRTLSFT
jgi:hypothetical protein